MFTILWAGISSMRRPSNRIRPWRRRTSPDIARRVVLLPAPLLPIRVTISPGFTSSETPRSAMMPPYPADTSCSESSGAAPFPAVITLTISRASDFLTQVGLDNLRVPLHFGRCALGDFFAVVQDCYPFAHAHHDSHLVFDEDDGYCE